MSIGVAYAMSLASRREMFTPKALVYCEFNCSCARHLKIRTHGMFAMDRKGGAFISLRSFTPDLICSW